MVLLGHRVLGGHRAQSSSEAHTHTLPCERLGWHQLPCFVNWKNK